MQTMAIRDLKNNPSDLTKYLENDELVFVTKHGKPIGITMPLNENTLSIGIKKAVALELYKSGAISMGKMAEILQISKSEAMKLLNDLKIDWIEYTQKELDDEAKIVEKWLNN